MRLRDFSFITNTDDRNKIMNGCAALDKLELWTWLAEYRPDDGFGYSIDSHPNMYEINKCMETLSKPQRHSRFSFMHTMRHLRFIAKFGMDKYCECVTRGAPI
jgi:hypothetical protein